MIDTEAESLVELSHRIHEFSETAFEEHRSSEAVADKLAKNGFEVERGVGNLPTAIAARSGPGPMQIVLCAEYDALPDLGHACGHNIIAASSVGAALGLATVAEELGIEVVVLGTPAEENGGGKIALIEARCFDEAHVAMMVHPAPYDVVAPPVLALDWMHARFDGKEAHASAFPDEGINAADAMVIAQVAIGLLRQHLPTSARVHGFVERAGSAANVIPALAEASYIIRTHRFDQLDTTRERVVACFEAGGLATGSDLTIDRPSPAYAHLEHHPLLGLAYRANAEALGRSFHEGPVPPVSTDMGNVSLRVPSLHPFIGIDSLPATNHQPGFAAAASSPAGDRAVLDGARALAWTAIDAATEGALRVQLFDSQSSQHSG